MDRQIVYPAAIPLETDLLNTNRNILVAIGLLAQDILGTSTLVAGLACGPNSPTGLTVVVGPGRIYSQQNVDSTAYGSLPLNTSQQIIKQGISVSNTTLACPAPTTAGFSVNYLIQATYSDVDGSPVTLPYYNSSNPSQAYSGPGGTGAAQNTVRQGQVLLQAKAGIPAATGTQTTPAADSGFVGLWVVTVAFGQTLITSGNIAQAAAAPFFNSGLAPLASPALTGSPTAPTQAVNDRSTKLATTAFANPGGLLAPNGYGQFPSGIIIQAGTFGISFPAAGTYSVSVTLPEPFPTGFSSVVAMALTSTPGAYSAVGYVADGLNKFTAYGFASASNPSQSYSYIAFGY